MNLGFPLKYSKALKARKSQHLDPIVPRPKENWIQSLYYSQEPLSAWLEKLRQRAVIWILFHPLGRQESQVYAPPKHLANSVRKENALVQWGRKQNPLETVVGYWVTKNIPLIDSNVHFPSVPVESSSSEWGSEDSRYRREDYVF